MASMRHDDDDGHTHGYTYFGDLGGGGVSTIGGGSNPGAGGRASSGLAGKLNFRRLRGNSTAGDSFISSDNSNPSRQPVRTFAGAETSHTDRSSSGFDSGKPHDF